MKTRTIAWKIMTLWIAVAILAGCKSVAGPTLEPTIDTQPTFSAIQTEAVSTAVMAMTASAPTATEVVPTDTPTLTSTPAATSTSAPLPPTATPTKTPLPTSAVVYATPTSASYNCSITSVSPTASDKVKAGVDFDGRWVVKNTGTQTWDSASVDYKYFSGTKFQVHGDSFDFTSSVTTGNSITIIVDMLAPTTPGWYYATWGIVRGNQTICALDLTVQVVQ
ncbi:MAG TPA: NBR1-Ig-like domain-containing protein [Anaerolineaceae bacterium]